MDPQTLIIWLIIGGVAGWLAGLVMTGGGFGACIVALTQPRAVEPLTNHLNDVYPKKTGQQPGIFVTTATAGAEVIE